MLNLTGPSRIIFRRYQKASESWAGHTEQVQRQALRKILHQGHSCLWVDKHLPKGEDTTYEEYCSLMPVSSYQEIRPMVMDMIQGKPDVLWPGVVRRYAQSSGTSDGKSKFVPITTQGLRQNHYGGSAHSVARYLQYHPKSRLFSGRALILGGSFATELPHPANVRIGDLSANLIEAINPIANIYRVPRKPIALMQDWEEKLPALVESCIHENVTNISGVPSWFLVVLQRVIERQGVRTIHEVWPNLELFFHGGISFEPYRKQYQAITDNSKMHYLETYNASEGFFAVQYVPGQAPMQLLLDVGVFYEFEDSDGGIHPAWDLEKGKTYALIITSCNGLWRYPIGDTVKICDTDPLTITIAGRTKSFINAFGEELMVYNAEEAITKACQKCQCSVANYTAAPVYAEGGQRGHHQWLIEFTKEPKDMDQFAQVLDKELQNVNSDYQAKRAHTIFLDNLSIVKARRGLFDSWLKSTGRLGGQRKVPRLSNDRQIIEQMLKFNE